MPDFNQGGPSLAVTANNGWSASVTAGQNDNVTKASGVGRRDARVAGGIAGKPFKRLDWA
jgi:hypothetical protein